MKLEAVSALVDQRIGFYLKMQGMLLGDDDDPDEDPPPQPCDQKFTTSGTALTFRKAYNSAKGRAKLICKTNTECPNPKFIRYISYELIAIDHQWWAHVTVEWQCFKKTA